MLETINMIRAALYLPPVDKLCSGMSNKEIIENTLKEGSKLSFGAGTNYIEAWGDFYGDANKEKVISSLKNVVKPGTAWKSEEGVAFWTPNDIADFLRQ